LQFGSHIDTRELFNLSLLLISTTYTKNLRKKWMQLEIAIPTIPIPRVTVIKYARPKWMIEAKMFAAIPNLVSLCPEQNLPRLLAYVKNKIPGIQIFT